MAVRNHDLMLARERLGVTRSELAALLELEWGTYLELEKVADELPADVAERLGELKRSKLDAIDRVAIVPRWMHSRVVLRSRRIDDIAATVAVLACVAWGFRLAQSGRGGLGTVLMICGLFVAVLMMPKGRCLSCGGRVGALRSPKRCPHCDAELRPE